VSHRRLICALLGAGLAGSSALGAPALAQDVTATAPSDVAPMRPAVAFYRWQEDWSVLADPRTPRERLDDLKYIPLSRDDPKIYLSLGADLRERIEANDAASFGIAGAHPNDYLLSRFQVQADLHLGAQVQVYTQLQSDFAPGKTVLVPVDQDRLDLEQAFVAVTEPVDGGTLRLRFGRQEFGLDLQRFISDRDGPNVRQAYDAAWGEYERAAWKLIAFYTQPVQDQDRRIFDDYSSGRLTFSGVRVERQISDSLQVSVYYARFTQDQAHYLTVRGNERRNILDAHLSGARSGFDWDIEAMNQTGDVGPEGVRAWAVGSLAGYTFTRLAWAPRLGLQVDAASGDGNPNDHQLGTFNPLFPNGYYVTEASYTGYVNFIHVKPSMTLHPTKTLTLMLAAAGQWRETTADAVYTQPDIPLPGTAGQPGRYTGIYGQIRADWAISEHLAADLEAVHFAVAQVIRRAGGHDGDFLGVELKYGW
jgi:hypothetical protein